MRDIVDFISIFTFFNKVKIKSSLYRSEKIYYYQNVISSLDFISGDFLRVIVKLKKKKKHEIQKNA